MNKAIRIIVMTAWTPTPNLAFPMTRLLIGEKPIYILYDKEHYTFCDKSVSDGVSLNVVRDRMATVQAVRCEFVSCTEKFDTSTPMGRAMLNICIVFAQLERENIQMRVQDAFYSQYQRLLYAGPDTIRL